MGLRYANQDSDNMGVISAVLDEFGDISVEGYNGFTLDITYTLGTSGNTNRDNDILNEDLIVLYTAYK